MHNLTCDNCGNCVLVEKFSPTHTSVQWLTDDARDACSEFADRVAAGEDPNWIPTCYSLRNSIEQAVKRGELRTDDLRHEPVLGRIG